MLTKEFEQQLKSWIDYKHRTRDINHYDPVSKRSNITRITPKINEEVLIFSNSCTQVYTPNGLYMNIIKAFESVLGRLGGKFAVYENSTKRRRKITFHSFRRFVRSTVSNLGYSDFAERYILNHSSTSTYYRVPTKDRIEIFRKIEPSLYLLGPDFTRTKTRRRTK